MRSKLLQKCSNSWQKLTSGSTNRQIFGALITVGVGVFFSKVASVAKELVVAWKFGTADALDAFLIGFMVPSFITTVVTESFNVAFIPTYIQVCEQEGKRAAQKLFSGATVWSSALLLIMLIFVGVTAPLYLPKIATGFSAEKLNLTYKLLWEVSPSIVISGILTIWSAVLNATERFALTSFSLVTTPVLTIVLLLVVDSWGVSSLVVGIVAGQLLSLVIIGVGLQRQNISLLPKWYGFDGNLRQVVNQYIPTIAGSFLMCSCTLVDQSMAAMLAPGSVAALNYGNRVVALPIMLTTTALSTAVIPYFSKMVASEDWKSIRHTLNRYLRLIFATTLPLTLLFIFFSEPITRLLYERGSFTANDTRLVAEIQNCFALQIPFYVADMLMVRLVSAMRANQILMWVSGFSLVINIGLNYLLMQWLGIKGIALSTSFVYLFCLIYTSISAEITLRKISNKSLKIANIK